MELGELCARYDEELAVADYADVDASPNGLQVGPPSAEIEHVAFAVDAVVETVERAAEAGADLLVTHHGMIWGGIDRVTEKHYRRIAPLIENDLALYVAHLPLDGHQDLGNAAGLAETLDLGNRAPFGTVGDQWLGQRGRLPSPTTAADLAATLEAELDTGDQDVQVLDVGPDDVHDVAILTGSGADWLDAAVDAGADALITGEGKGKLYHEAKEAGITVLLAGHYATETFGVQSLQALAEEWGLRTTYVDCPTGL